MNPRPWKAAMGLATALVASAIPLAPAAAAVKAPQHAMQQKRIVLNGKTVSQPVGFADHGTAYFPGWYLMRALDSLHVTSSWDGHNWRITVPSGMKVDLSKIDVGTGNVSIYVNGTLVKRVYDIVDIDPASHQPTMYIPVWYVMRVFDRLGIQSSWNGQTWTMTTPSTGPGGGSSGGTGSSGTGSGGSGSGGTAPASPPDTTPQASDIPGTVSKGALVADLVSALGLPVSAPATSPYDDVPASDPRWPAIATAVSRGLISPFSSTHFGTGDVVTLDTAERMVWNQLGITNARYQPGGSLDAWAQFVGLTDGIAGGQYLTQADEARFVQNLRNLRAGGTVSGGVLQVRYTPQDEWAWTFAGDQTADGTPYYPTDAAVQEAITKTYRFFNGVTARLQGGDLVVQLPVDPDGRWFAYASTAGDLQYSLDGGSTWTTAAAFDDRELTWRPAQVWVKAPASAPLQVTFNNMVPAAKGSVVLGWVSISVNPSTGNPQAQRVYLQ
ncbi:S-layer homology domain-containing protein [Alicyclobacillus macrosporangiidus]|uniref:S-layer homology domain-containing protein n=1 Tax=Alicyclobacillus macrosporangiidus TaxID=392015 RepID=UPI00049706EE|nr:S-layer homology domain-containing protein [Alicyclobacillus macrosporangiidus]